MASRVTNPADPSDPVHPHTPDQSVKGHFLPGNSGTRKGVPGGRKRGSRVRFTAKVMHDLWADWRDHGAEAIARCREEDVSTYVRCAIALLPKDINVNVNPIEKMSDDRLLEYIRGLEEAIVAAVAAASGATGGDEGGAATTIEHEEIKSLSPVH